MSRDTRQRCPKIRHLPFMQSLFGTAALSPRHWVIPIVIGLGIFAAVEVEKAVVRAWERRHPQQRGAAAAAATAKTTVRP